jgi:hypothetical protein
MRNFLSHSFVVAGPESSSMTDSSTDTEAGELSDATERHQHSQMIARLKEQSKRCFAGQHILRSLISESPGCF